MITTLSEPQRGQRTITIRPANGDHELAAVLSIAEELDGFE